MIRRVGQPIEQATKGSLEVKATKTAVASKALIDNENFKLICEKLESFSFSNRSGQSVDIQPAVVSKQEITDSHNDLSWATNMLSNPFEKPNNPTTMVKPSRIMVTLPPHETPVTAEVQAQAQFVSSSDETASSRKSLGFHVVQQQTIDSLSRNFDKFKSRVAELEDTIKIQQTQIAQKDATIRSQETKMIMLQHECQNDNTSIASLQLKIDMREKERDEARQAADRSQMETQSMKSKLDASKIDGRENATLQTELVTVRNDMAKISEEAKSHKAEVQKFQDELRKAQTLLLDAMQKAELARKEARDLKKSAENADASAKDTSNLKAKAADLETQLKENSILAQQR